MNIKPKHKMIIGVIAVASTILLSLGLLFNTLSGKGLNTTSNNNKTSSEFNTKVENTETKDAPHFSIFSILNKLIPN